MKWTNFEPLTKTPPKKRGRKAEPEVIGRVAHTTDGRFHLIQPDAAHRTGYRIPDGKRYAILETRPGGIGLGPYIGDAATKAEADAICVAHEAIRLKVWHYFTDQAEREKSEAQRTIAEGKLKDCCGYVQQTFPELAQSTVEDLAWKSYTYMKYRALLTGPGCWSNCAQYDPAAARDWQAMQDGTYVQWWERQTG